MPKEFKVLNMRGIDCPPELEEKFNKWYNEVHIPMLLKTGEVEEVTRFKRITEDPKYPRYLAVYYFKDKEAFKRYATGQAMKDVLAEMAQTWPPGKQPSFESKWSVQYEQIGFWKGK